jgi:hypothetical protein
MSISFSQLWTQWQGTSPASSASTTPGAAGNTLVVFGQNESGTSLPITPSAAAGSTVSPPGLVNDASGDTHGISANTSLTGVAQVATLTGNSGNTLEGVGAEYSGVGSVGSGLANNRASPGTGAGAIQGTAATVPSGSVLIACCKCVTALGVTISVAASGTTRGSNNAGGNPSYALGEWVGTGASVTPSFTDSGGGGGNSYEVLQVILTPAASSGTVQPTDIADTRPRPGRGPYSLGRYFRPSNDAIRTLNLSASIDTPGQITIAGQSVTASIGVALSVNGQITVAGQSVTPALTIPITNGAITVAGQLVTASIGVALSTNGQITVAGQSVSTSLGGNLSLGIDTPGQVTIAGQSVTTSIGIALGNGAITVAGQSVTAALGAVISSPGQITINGQSVALQIAGNVSVDIDVPGQITLAGQDITLLLSQTASGSSSNGFGGGGSWISERQNREHGKRLRKQLEEILDDLPDIYAQMTRTPQAKEVAAIVKPYADTKKQIPPTQTVDWEALRRDSERVSRLFAAWTKRRAMQDDEETWFMLGD